MTDCHQTHRSLRGHVTLTFSRGKVESTTNVPSQAGFVGYIAIALFTSTYGSGVYQWDVRLRDFVIWAKVR